MPSELERSLAAWRKRILDRDQEAAVRIMAAFGNALGRLQPMIALLDYEIEHMPSPTPAKLFRLERYQILERQLIDEMTALAQQTGSSVRGGEAHAIEWGQQAALELVQAAAAEPHEITGSFARVPADAVRDLVGTLSPESPAGKILESFGTDAATALREAITSGAALGQSPRVVARAMQKTVGMKATRALLISRTEMLRAYRTSTLARYSANADVLQGWKWVSAHNTRTCAACLAMDQTVFPLTTQFFPAHPACRCAASPVLKPEYAAKRKPPESGDQWLSRQSADVQDGILGKQGGAAYRAGEVALGDFVRVDDHPIWGESHRDGGIAWARARAERRRRKEQMAWMPTMTASAARQWSASSPLADRTMYHFTSADAARMIRSNGFRDGQGIYGRGIYTTTDIDATADNVGAAGSDVRLRVATNARNPAIIQNDTYNPFDGLYRELKRAGVSVPEEGFADVFGEFKKIGHDAIVLNFAEPHINPPWVIVFDKRKIVVIDDGDE